MERLLKIIEYADTLIGNEGGSSFRRDHRKENAERIMALAAMELLLSGYPYVREENGFRLLLDIGYIRIPDWRISQIYSESECKVIVERLKENPKKEEDSNGEAHPNREVHVSGEAKSKTPVHKDFYIEKIRPSQETKGNSIQAVKEPKEKKDKTEHTQEKHTQEKTAQLEAFKINANMKSPASEVSRNESKNGNTPNDNAPQVDTEIADNAIKPDRSVNADNTTEALQESTETHPESLDDKKEAKATEIRKEMTQTNSKNHERKDEDKSESTPQTEPKEVTIASIEADMQENSVRHRVDIDDPCEYSHQMHVSDILTLATKVLMYKKDDSGARPNTDKPNATAAVIASPMAHREGPVRIMVYGQDNQGRKTISVSETPDGYAEVTIGEVVIMVRGYFKDDNFRLQFKLPSVYKEQGWVYDYHAKKPSGKVGHLMVSDEGIHIHVLPVNHKNNAEGMADFIYCVLTDDGLVQSGMTDVEKTPMISYMGESLPLTAQWAENEGMIAACVG